MNARTHACAHTHTDTHIFYYRLFLSLTLVITSLINKSSIESHGKNVYELKPENIFSIVICTPIDGTINNISG